jgi:serine/threonine-protein kinase RsbW
MKKVLSLTLASDLDELGKMDAFVNSIRDAVSCDADTGHHIMLVLTEAVTNAILHGNRQQPDKTVDIRAELAPERVVISVLDQGDGFDPDSIPNPLEEQNLLKSSGRGVWLMREFADAVRFRDDGRHVELEFKLKP